MTRLGQSWLTCSMREDSLCFPVNKNKDVVSSGPCCQLGRDHKGENLPKNALTQAEETRSEERETEFVLLFESLKKRILKSNLALDSSDTLVNNSSCL